MKLPRDVSGAELVRKLERIGYSVTRTVGSHARLTCLARRAHHVTVPLHEALRVGTLAAILAEVAAAQELSRDEVVKRLFG